VHSVWCKNVSLCFPSDLLSHSITQLVTIIFTCDPHNENGSHWLAINFQPKSFSGFYFDSYGLHPYIPSIHYLLKRNCSVWTITQPKYKVWLVRYVANTDVFSLSTWTGDIRRNSSSASLTQGQPTNRLLRCSHQNSGLVVKQGELEAVSAALVRGK